MRGDEQDPGSRDSRWQDDSPPDDPEPKQGDLVIELINGVPYVYTQNAENEAEMAKIRDRPNESDD